MKRFAFYGIILLLSAVLIYAGWRGITWLVGTEDGARWMFASVSRHTPLKISARKIEGRLLDRIRLSDVHLALDPIEVDLRYMDWNWQPLSLVSGMVAIENLAMTGVSIKDRTPQKRPPDLRWPKVSWIASLFDVSIKKLTIDDVSYVVPFQTEERNVHQTGLHSNPFSVSDISVSASVLWRHSSLTVRNMILSSPYGQLQGELAAGFYQPTLRVDLRLASRRHFAKMDVFSVQGRFEPGRHPEQITGDFAVSGSSGNMKLLDLKGKAGMAPNAFNLKNLRLIRPGRSGVITGEGNIMLRVQEPLLSFKLMLNGVDLTEELKLPANIDGLITLKGTPSRYDGNFNMTNIAKGWQKAAFSGHYSGSRTAAKIDNLSASLLSGSVQGELSLKWQEGFLVKGLLRGKDINPANLNPDMAGVVNFDLAGDLERTQAGAFSASLRGRLLESRLQGQLVTGALNAGFANGRVHVEKLVLKGNGFDIKASGIPEEKFTFGARIEDMGRLLSGAAGAFSADGWVRFSDGRLSGSAVGHGKKIHINDVKIGAVDLNGFIGTQEEAPLRIHADLRDVSYKNFPVSFASVKMKGTASQHHIDATLKTKAAEMQLSLSGGLHQRLWRGYIEQLSGRDVTGPWKIRERASVSVSRERIAIAELALVGNAPERLEMGGELTKDPRGGFLAANWTAVNIERLSSLFPRDIQYSGLLSGKMEGRMLPDGHVNVKGQTSVAAGKLNWHRKVGTLDMLIPAGEFSWNREERTGGLPAFRLAGRAKVNGSITTEATRIVIKQGTFSLDGSEEGIRAEAELSPEEGGLLKAGFSSAGPLAFALPETGEFNAHWAELDTKLFRFLLPGTFKIEGRLTGTVNGRLVSGRRLSLTGKTFLSPPAGADEGKIRFLRKDGEMNVNFRSASLALDWKEKSFNCDVSLSLSEFGHVQGSVWLPISASLPVAFDKKKPLYASFRGKLKENGLLTYLFPGVIKESRGEMDADVVVEGNWEKPLSNGRLKLTKAGAYLPDVGIDVEDVEVSLAFEKDLVRVDSFQARSGPGRIYGKGLVRLNDWRVYEFEGNIEGSDFRLVYLPELQVKGAPHLQFRGTPEKVTLRGEVKLPELLIFGPPAGNFVSPSSDVVFEGKPHSNAKTLLPVFDAKVRLTLGDRALVKMKGLDAKLAGSIDLNFQSLDKIVGEGEIRTVGGSYNAYGVNLQISRGRLFYAGGPINQPALDILAVRSAADVKAGVTIGGILSAPVIRLYSKPVMSEVDTLSYIVFGHPLSNRSSAEQISTLAQAAGFLLSRGKAAGLQEQLKKKLGLSTLDIQSRDMGPAGSIGYKKIDGDLSPPGATTEQGNNVSETFVAVGKYLTPQLYLSYGRSLFTENNLFSLRYDISKRWQIETVTGTESGRSEEAHV